MGSELPKQFHLLQGKPVIWHSVKAFAEAYSDIRIIVVLHASYLEHGPSFSLDFPTHVIRVVEGGSSRFDSVKNGLKEVDEASQVFVHDAVRCLVTTDLIRRCGESATRYGNAVPCIEPGDSMRVIIGERNEVLSREFVRLVQTPQVFSGAVLKQAFSQPYQAGFTDEANVVESIGETIHLIPGETENIKLTTPVDMAVAQHLMMKRLES
jgi:2-C-methyl-D-erythritol 4-phosphate cytidylyltransferase